MSKHQNSLKQQKQARSFDKLVPQRRRLTWGVYGIQVLGPVKVPTHALDTWVRIIGRRLKKKGRVLLLVHPDKVPVSRKPLGTRMGKGKGPIAFYVTRIHKGDVVFQITGVSKAEAQDACALIHAKFPVPTRFVYKTDAFTWGWDT